MGLNWQNKMAVGQILLLKKMYVEEPSHKHTNSIMYIYLWNLGREGRIFIMKFEKKKIQKSSTTLALKSIMVIKNLINIQLNIKLLPSNRIKKKTMCLHI